MKKYLLGAGVILIGIAIIIGYKLSNVPEQVDPIYATAAALYGTDTVALTEDETYSEGTEQNPFVILEIVPYEGYAEIGYMVQGCEPVPMDIVAFDKAGGALITSSTTGMTGSWVDEYNYELASGEKVMLDLAHPVDSADPTKITALTDLADLGKWRNAGAAEYGYYTKVATDTGSYYQETRTVDGFDAIIYVSATTEKKGNYNWTPYTDSTKPDGTHTTTDMWKVTTLDQDRIDTYRTKYYRGKYNFAYDADHNKFLTEVLKMPYANAANYKITVLTITPEQLSQKTALIDKVDLISFAPNSHYYVGTTNSMVSLWEKYHPSKTLTTKPISFGFNTDYTTCKDLTWEATVEILRKASVDNNIAPVIFDSKVYTADSSFYRIDKTIKYDTVTPTKIYSDGTTSVDLEKIGGKTNANYINITTKGYLNNIAKLFLVMEQMDPVKFYSEYITTGLIKPVNLINSKISSTAKNVKNGTVNITIGCYTEQVNVTPVPTEYDITKLGLKSSAVGWSIYTFLPYNLFANKAAIYSNEAWEKIGIDNYAAIDSDLSKVVSTRHNIYTYNGDKSLTQDLVKTDKITYNASTINAFEYFGLGSGTMAPAKAIQYLLNSPTMLSYSMTTLRILEIEPCKDFIWDGTEAAWDANDTNISSTNGSKYARQFYEKFFPHFNGNVTINTMTSAEYIGNVEDINTKYDMIFFGLRDGKLKASTDAATVYNDTTLNGKIYLHNGDLITMSISKLKGLNDDSGTNTYRLSGNDITNFKYTELIDYMKAGNPLVLDTGFYDTTNKTTVNTIKIDSASYIYNLANEINTASSYVDKLFSADGISIYKLESKLSTNKCKIIFGNTKNTLTLAESKPVTYKDKTVAGNGSLTDPQIYINGSNKGFRTLQYKFYITSDMTTTTDYYTAKLYIDVNADGKYDESTENMSSLQIMTDSGVVVNYKKLKPGVNYTLTRTLEADYFGVLPWKLEIVSSTNREIRDSVIDYSALQTTTPIDLYILQIKANDYSNNNLDLADEMANSTSTFGKLLNNLQDYKIHITAWTVDEYIAKCGSGTYKYLLSDDDDYNSSGLNKSIDDDGDGIYDFDMLIMGFADCYSDIGSPYALENIKDFIEEGKSVLFTHDTTSFVNMPKTEYEDTYGFDDFWGYGLNSTFRNIFGMDRFGVMLGTESERSLAGKDYSAKNTTSVKAYSGYIQGYANMVLNRYAAANKWVYSYQYDWVYSYHYAWVYSYHYAFERASKNDRPASDHYEWKSTKSTGYWINGYWENGYYVNGYWGDDTQYLSHINVNNSDFNTNTVTNVNQGQLTVYPYSISDTFPVATTHAQYYQLDMENKDIVVWYCLSDSYTGGNGRYSTTPNDVRNNYYIYNVGNITYSGVGHSTVNSDMEAKLFVNTMVGAYSATARAPQIKITNKNTSKDATTNYVYVDYDIYDTALAVGSEITTGDSTKAQLVKFRIIDYNILFNKKMYVSFFDNSDAAKPALPYTLINTAGTTEILDDTVMTGTTVNGTYVYKIDASEEYAIAVPLTDLNIHNMSGDIGINILITYGKASNKTKNATTTFKLVRRGLFDLD